MKADQYKTVGIIGNADVAPLYVRDDVALQMQQHRGVLDAKSQYRKMPFIAERTEVIGKGKDKRTVTRKIVVMAVTYAEALPKLRRIAKEYFLSHPSPWRINNGNNFTS